MRRADQLEKILVGGLLDSKEPMKLLQAAGLQPEDFQDAQLRLCWAIALDLAQRGLRVDAVTLFAAGRATKAIADDDLGVLQALQSRNTLDTGGFVEAAKEFRRHAHSRKVGAGLLELGKELLGGKATTRDAWPRFVALHETYQRLHAEGRRGSDAVVAAFEAFNARQRDGKQLLVPTGLELLDNHTGGLPPKLTVLLGQPGIGKSALLATVLLEQLKAGLRVLLFSLEDGDEWLVKRHLARMLGLKFRDVLTKEFPDGAAAADAAAELSRAFEKLWIVTKRAASTAADVVRITTQYVGQGIDLVYVDNATALRLELNGKFDEPRRAAGRNYSSLAECADTYRVPMVVLAHTTRKYEERTRGKGPPSMEDIAETADAERYVRLAIGLWRKQGNFRATVLKHTEGEAGTTFEFGMHHDAGLVDASSGAVVNMQAEARKEREESHEKKLDRRLADTLAMAERRKQLKTPPPPTVEAPQPEAQLDLLAAPKESIT